MTKEERVSHWRALVEQQALSGLSAVAFCREKAINAQRFYQWRQRFCEKPLNEMSSGFVELIHSSEHPHSGIRIRVEERLCIEVDRTFDPFTLRAVVEALCGGRDKSCSP
jgi:hypothetical protein